MTLGPVRVMGAGVVLMMFVAVADPGGFIGFHGNPLSN